MVTKTKEDILSYVMSCPCSDSADVLLLPVAVILLVHQRAYRRLPTAPSSGPTLAGHAGWHRMEREYSLLCPQAQSPAIK